ncbi:MAG: DUF4331 family protein [Deltaproteobacteria bacterium]|nr:DUF4331 family protein [Deltaproteobacteria bacterium]
MTKKNLITMTALALASSLAFAGCGDDDGDDTDDTVDMFTPTGDMGGEDMGGGGDDDMFVPDPMPRGMDNPPAIGAQIDRAARPGVTTALVGTFTETDDDTRGTLKDDYNADADAAGWVGEYAATIHSQLAVLDGLDGVCGDQLAFDANPLDDGSSDYDFLANVLANDRVWVNSTRTACAGAYLGVELETLGLVGDGEGGCGGRMPAQDVIDATYSVLAGGLPLLTAGGDGGPAVTDGVPFDDEDGTLSDTFPFLAAP